MSTTTTTKASHSIKTFYRALTRKKPLDCRTDTQLKRCLNLVDLTALGVGSTLGLGLYVLAGQVAANKAGPAVIISFAIAALASAFSALCYAEFAARVPKAGSAYAYSYITVGEFVAFIIGWNMILEYVIGAASVARGFSGYIMFVFDSHLSASVANASSLVGIGQQNNVTLIVTATQVAANNTESMSKLNSEWMDWSPFFFGKLFAQFDLLTLVIIFVITCLMLYGVKESTNFTMLFTCVNLMVVIVAVCGGLSQVTDLHNWRLAKWELPSSSERARDLGEGGFMPYGWTGILAGSATCFFGFIGFDTIASSAEEAKDPKRNVPLAILLSLAISFLAYFATAAIQTLVWPYYDQNKIAVLPYIFDKLDMPVTYWILLLGAIAGLTSSQCGSIYPLPRILYSMARDSIIYNYLSKIDAKQQTPVRATVVGSMFIGLLACLLDIEELADMVSIGTLAAYSLVSVAVLILRYENNIAARCDTPAVVDYAISRISYPDITTGGQSVVDKRNEMYLKEVVTGHQQRSSLDQETGNYVSNLKSQVTPTALNNSNKQQSLDGQVGADKDLMTVVANGKRKHSTPIRLKGSRPIEVVCCDTITSSSAASTSSSTGKSAKTIADNAAMVTRPNDATCSSSKKLISLSIFVIIILDIIIYLCSTATATAILFNNLLTQLTLGTLILIIIVLSCLLSRLPNNNNSSGDTFQVPLVPLIPFLSIFVNTYLMLNLGYLTWLRFSIWMLIGFFIYFTYGIWHSTGYLIDD